MEIDASTDLQDFTKQYDFNILGAGALDLHFQEVLPVVPQGVADTIIRECLVLGKGVDNFGNPICDEWTTIMSAKQIIQADAIAEPIDTTLTVPSKVEEYSPKNDVEIPVKQIFEIPALTVSKGTKRIVRVTWTTIPKFINRLIQTSGNWEMNPSGVFITGASVIYPINLSGAHQALDFNTTLSIRNFPMTANCIDNNRLTVVYNANGTPQEVNADIIGDCRIQDVNIFYKTPTGIQANVDMNWGDTNGLSIQILDANTLNPARNLALVYDSENTFEDQSVAPYTLTLSVCATGTLTTSNVTAAQGIYSAKFASTGACASATADKTIPNNVHDWSAYVRREADNYYGLMGDGAGGDNYTGISNGNAFVTAINSVEATGGTPANATWYWMEAQGGGDINGYFYNLNHTLNTTVKKTGAQAAKVQGRIQIDNAAGAATVYFDNVAWWKHIDSPPTQTFGTVVNKSGTITYSNYITSAGINYVKTLDYNFVYTCNVAGTLTLRINASGVQANTLTCDATQHSFLKSYTRSVDGNTTVDANNTNDGNITFISPIQMTWDYTAPIINTNDSNVADGNFNARLKCTDVLSPLIDFNVLSNGVTVSHTQAASGSTVYWNNLSLSPGPNVITFACSDLLGNTVTAAGTTAFFIQIKIPKNIRTLVNITPYNISSLDLNVNLTGLVIDRNFTGVSSGSSITVTIDANTDFFPSDYVFDTNTTTVLQPYLVPRSGNFEVTTYTINNQQGRASLPHVFIKSYTNISGINTLVESKFSDGTGTALMHFVAGQTYEIKATYNGVLKLDIPYVPSSTNLFLFIDLGIASNVITQGGATIEWYHSPSQIVPAIDGNIAIYQILKPFDTIIGDVNLFASQNGVIFYNRLFHSITAAADYNLSYDLNVATLNQYALLIIDLYIYDVNGVLLLHQNGSYTVVQTTTYINLIQNFKDGFGLMFNTLLSVLIVGFIISRIVVNRIGEDNNFLGVIALVGFGFFAFLGFVSFTAYFFAVLMGCATLLWKLRD